jgi:hypothetical protein
MGNSSKKENIYDSKNNKKYSQTKKPIPFLKNEKSESIKV